MSGGRLATVCVLVAVLLVATAVPVGGTDAAMQPTRNESAGAGAIVASAIQSEDGPVNFTSDTPFGRGFYGTIETVATRYDGNEVDLGQSGRFLRGKDVNLHVTGPDGTTTVVSFRLTRDKRIRNVRAGGYTDPDIRMHTDRETVREIASAESVGRAFQNAVERDEIRIEGTGVVGDVLWRTLNALRDAGL